MKQMQQDSLSQQLKKLEQEAQIAEQRAFSKNAESQAAQNKLDGLKQQIERETARLKAKQEAELTATKQVLTNAIKAAELDLAAKNGAIADASSALLDIESNITSAKDRLLTATKAIQSAQDDLAETRKQQLAADIAVEGLKQRKVDLERDNSALQTEKMLLSDDVASLKKDKARLKDDISALELQYEESKLSKDEQIQLLDRKIIDLTADLEQKLAEDQQTRKSLAEWESRLEAQGQNLRVRELKVAQGEDKIVRNSALLNL